MSCAADRISQTCPTWSQWTGAINTVPTAGTETEDIESVDFGTVAPGDNSNAIGLSIEFPSNFDDTIHTEGARLFLINKPLAVFAGNTIAAEIEAGATFPALALDDPLAGPSAAVLGGSYAKAAAVHTLATTAEYDATDKRIADILVQLQVSATPAQRWVGGEIFSCPLLTLVTPRTDYDTENRIMRADVIGADLESGHLYNYPNTRLYFIYNYGEATEAWYLIEDAMESTIEFEPTKEFTQAMKGRTQVVIHEAVSAVNATLRFTSQQLTPMLEAIAMQTDATRNASLRQVQVDINGCACINGVKEFAWAMEYQTQGGFLCQKIIPRGTLKFSGAYGGGDSFTEYGFEVTAKSYGNCRTVAKSTYSDTPVLFQTLPLQYRIGS